MSWASRRRGIYLMGVLLFFVVVIGGPLAYKLLTIPETCHDGIQNQGEVSIDRGGPCLLLDARTLSPTATLWARSFRVRDGSYSSVAYIQNPNEGAGVESVSYRFRLYDSENVLIAERTNSTFIMPSATTPVFQANISTGNRIVARTYFELLDTPQWQRVRNAPGSLALSGIQTTNLDSAPSITALVKNTGPAGFDHIGYIATVFDTAGNAFASSATEIAHLDSNASATITFTWPEAFSRTIGRIDILPLLAPQSDTAWKR